MSSGNQVDFTFHTLSVPITRVGYGIQFEGHSPVCLCTVESGSVADQAGAQVGDYLITLNGKDVQFSNEEEVGTALKYSYGSALELRVARPHPLPQTSIDKRKAILVLQTKLRTGDYVTCGDQVENYKSKLNSALANVDDILGGFELPTADQMVPSYGGTDQEVEIKMYDSDNLSSPLSSKGSEVELTYDPLLDFSRDDNLTLHHGNQKPGGDMTKSVREMQREMERMKQLMKDVSDKKGKKRLPQQSTPSMKTEASFSPSYSPNQAHRTQPAVSKPQPSTAELNQELDDLEAQLQWISSPLETGSSRPPPVRTDPPRQVSSPPRQAQTEVALSRPVHREVSPPVRQPERSVSPPAKQQERNIYPATRQPVSPPRQPEQSVPPPAKQPERSVSPSSRQPERSISPPTRQPERSDSPPASQPQRSISPPKRSISPSGEKPGKKKDRSKPPKKTKSPPPVSPTGQEGKGKFSFGRGKKPKDQLPGRETSGYVGESEKRGNKGTFNPGAATKPRDDDPCRGLPANVHEWRKEEVGQWLKQFSMSLYAHYFPLFSRHQITGQSLLRLTQAKLNVMGITNTLHNRSLATEIARLRIIQEQSELRNLQRNSDDESGKISDL